MFSYADTSIVLIADPRVLAIPIIENNEKFFDLRDQSDILIGPSPEIPNNTDYTFVREAVYKKLREANKMLPRGLHFCLYEGYRSLALQKKLFDHRYAINKKLHPTWKHADLFNKTTQLVSPIINLDNSQNIPPHSTGGAIDVYLVDDNGKAVDMGIHPGDWMDDDGVLSETNSQAISETAKKNREIMGQVLQAQGFVNYPTEYWHWSYGDRYWAYVKKAPHAIYSTKNGA